MNFNFSQEKSKLNKKNIMRANVSDAYVARLSTPTMLTK